MRLIPAREWSKRTIARACVEAGADKGTNGAGPCQRSGSTSWYTGKSRAIHPRARLNGDRPYWAVQPPSIQMSVPVIQPAASEQR